MPYKFLIGVPLLWFGGYFISQTIELASIAGEATNFFEVVMEANFASYTSPQFGIGGLFTTPFDWVNTLLGIVSWNFSQFRGYFQIVQFPFFCLSIAWVVSLGLALIRGVGSG